MTRLRTSRRRQGMSPVEAAAYWVVQRDAHALSAREEAEFEAWRANPTNAEALRRAEGATALFDRNRGSDPGLSALRQSALDAAPAPRPRRYAAAVGGVIAAGLVIAVILCLWRRADHLPMPAGHPMTAGGVATASGAHRAAGPMTFETGVGERRTVRLSDGTVITLNTRSRLVLAFAKGRRVIRLVRGQVLFEGAPDRNVPFVIDAADWHITAPGASVEARVDPGRVNVILYRGRADVARAATSGYSARPPSRVSLKPGQQFTAQSGGVPKVASIDVERQLLWRDGFVEFDDEPLSQAVAEINRYATRQITLSNDGVAALRISGHLRTDTPGEFVEIVRRLLPAEGKLTEEGTIELSLAASSRP